MLRPVKLIRCWHCDRAMVEDPSSRKLWKFPERPDRFVVGSCSRGAKCGCLNVLYVRVLRVGRRRFLGAMKVR